MRKMTKHVAILALVALTVLALTACGKQVAERIAEEAIEESTGGDADVDISGDGEGSSVTITGEDDEQMTITSGDLAEVPDGYPDDFPLYEGQVTGAATMESDEGSMITVSVMVDDTADEVAAAVKDELGAEGWTTLFNMDNNDADMRTISFVVEKGGRNGTITIVDDGESVVVSHSVVSD